MRCRSILVMAVALVAACAGRKPVAEPQLVGGESPAAFQRAIGLTLLRTGQPRGALPHLQRLARLEPGRAEPLCHLGRAFMDLEMWQQARASLDQAIALDPRHAPAHALFGVLLDARGDHHAAVAAHRRAAALDPNNAAYRNNLGFALYLDGRYAEALVAYDDALRLGPGLGRIHNNLGFAFGKLGRIEDASEQFRLGGTGAGAANNLGLVYEDRGELARAYDAFAEAVHEAPDLVAARGNLERICERLGKPLPAVPDGRK
jgi:Flp pilus assembly protein TadD